MEKRGISPLIATVLIIGFTIVLAAAIFQWGGSLVEKLKSQSEESLIKITCVSDVNIGVKQACDMINSVLLTVDNKGNIPIKGLTVRLIGEKTAVQKVEEGIDPFGAKKISATIPYDMRSNRPTKVEVFPRILVDGKEQTCASESKDMDATCGIQLPDVNNINDDWSGTGELKLVSDPTFLATIPENIRNQYNLNGLGMANDGTITSKQFTIPAGFKGVTVGGWVGTGTYTFKLNPGSEASSINNADTPVYIGNIKLAGSGTVTLQATGTGLITISEIGLYE